MSKLISILIVDDDSMSIENLKTLFNEEYRIIATTNSTSAVQFATHYRPDLMLLDFNMPVLNGLDILRHLKQKISSMPIIMLTGETNPNVIVDAIKAGASDYVVKGTEDFIQNLQLRIKQTLQISQIKKENDILLNRLKEESQKFEILGVSPEVTKLKSLIEKFKGEQTTVLIHGESGTGKELVARNLNIQESDHSRPFIAVNCGAISPHLFESELFGHVKGSFTGANENKTGKFVAANGGDIFLDEIGELPLDMQVKLLRVLQEESVTPVGSNKLIPIHVRIIAATNRDLQEMVGKGAFREDLFYRLSKINISTPPLRKRPEDILYLAKEFAQKYFPGAVLTKEAKTALKKHAWLGNIRELHNVIEAACVFARTDHKTKIDLEHIILTNRELNLDSISIPRDLFPRTLEDITKESYTKSLAWVEKNFLLRGLEITKEDNQALIDRIGIGKTAFYDKKKELGLSKKGSAEL